ncbi:uncharacterized protein LOC133392815 [Anopheles gambiae]|uniref:uncharacterized protein LOC133392815 n=1 Tax=Anopheles gambiae TaxID=7165 RepID=UPI002AC9DA89|nr:uncharacterized protein LOC133392815 [Anopheles gambiae]
MEQPEDVAIHVKKEGSRTVIEVKGKHIVLSGVKPRIEQLLSSSTAQEVHILAGTSLSIDADLSRDVWHGLNLVVLANEITVPSTITWDVSGNDSNHNYAANAGTSEDGHGKDGNDGYPGESGGNVLLLANAIQNPEQLTIISNGGNGTCGQDGGDGEDGVDGNGISRADFDRNFQHCLFWKDIERRARVHKIVKNMMDLAHSVKTQWAKVTYTFGNSDTYTSNVLELPIKTFHDYLDMYVEVVTQNGSEIIFSLYEAVGKAHSFFVYKGSPGVKGKPGGMHGLGGQGGFPGEIIVKHLHNERAFEIKTCKKGGKYGDNGKGGLCGKHGKNGWDMGYLGWLLSEPTIYGRDENSKLQVSYYKEDNRASSRIKCPYKAIHSSYLYVEINESKIDHLSQIEFRERNNIQARVERQHHSQVVGKKSILEVKIRAEFAAYLQLIATQKQRLAQQQIEQEESAKETESSQLVNLSKSEQQLAQKLKENGEYDALQQTVEGQHTDLERATDPFIKRFVNFTQDTSIHKQFSFVELHTMTKDTEQKKMIDILSNNLNLDDWLQLQAQVISDQHELESLINLLVTCFPHFNTLVDANDKAKVQIIVKTLKLKHLFAALNKKTHDLATYQTNVTNFELTAESIIRYLEETEEKNDTFHHPMLGSFRKYIFENSLAQRENIAQFVVKLSNSSDEAIKRAVETFILETGGTKTENEVVKQFYNEYHEFPKKQQNNIDALTESLATELKKSMHQEAFRLWNESVGGDTLPADLVKMIRQDEKLSSLYDKLLLEKNTEYDWERCSSDKKIQEIFKISIEQEGITGKSYRVLLAYTYDVNIRVYAKNEDNEIVLIEDHNPKSATVIHILQKENEFIQLKDNESYRQLEEERVHKDKIYRHMLTEIDAMQNMKDYFYQKISYLYGNSDDNAIEKLDENIAIEKIAAFFSDEEKDQIAQRLNTISSQYTNQYRVFDYMFQRFSVEGRHLSSNELCFLIDSILAHTVEARQERYTFSWIVAAYNQCNWTDELVLLQLENCYKRQLQEKPKWRKYMSKIENKAVLLVFSVQFTRKPCPPQCVEDILYLLSNIPIESVCLDELELTEWPYVLKECYWTHKLKSLLTWDNESEGLISASFFVLSIENTYGNKLMQNLFESLVEKRSELTHSMLLNVLSCFHKQKWNLCVDDLNVLKQSNLFEWIQHMETKYKKDLKELNISQIVTIIRGNDNTSSNIVKHLSEIEQSVANIQHNSKTINASFISNFLSNDVEKWAEEFQSSQNMRCLEKYEEMLAVIDRAIELKRGFQLRNTQRLTVLALLTNHNSTLAQVSTGEGKTVIVVAIAIIKVLFGEKVDIITSSSVLAKRDADDNKDIYGLFGISVSHNCSEKIQERKEAYSSNQIVYGDLGNFQRDYLLDRFYGKRILGDRSFENVIVDEVDSMLLDKGNNILYLSHDIAGMDKLESVYLYIWQMVNTPTDLSEDELVKEIKQSLLSDMYTLIQKADIQKLSKSLGKSNVLELWERLIKSGIINDSGRLQTQAIDSNKLEKLLSPDFTQYKDRLSFFIWSRIDRETNVKVPNFLKEFVERHLDSWISSALTALYMVPGQYYVVDVYRSGTSADRIANVIILDRDTGTDQVSSQWDEALHQFLQLKHGCKLSTQSLKAVFISNVTYLKKYKLLYGLTGTLGSQRERHLLEEIHQVDFVTVPTFKSKQFEEYEPIICSGKDDWLKQIHQEVSKLTKTDKRSVLIICETIQDVETLQKNIASKGHTKVRIYVRDYEKLDVTKGKLIPGEVIIATNLAGRGTDIKISDELEEAGGLHVILSYLPANIRIEEQGFGRAARKGERGSGQLIIMADGRKANLSMIFTLKQKRNVDELFRLSAIKAYYKTTIKTEENCFEAFNELYEKKMKLLANAETPEPVKDILLQSCLDRWSFWLDENNVQIGKASDEASKREVKQRLKHFLLQFDDLKATSANNWAAWVEENPMQMIKLGKYISEHESEHRDTALQLFGKVISSEPCFCEAAYYYRAYTRSLDNMNIGDFKKDLRLAGKLFDDHIQCKVYALGIVSKQKDTAILKNTTTVRNTMSEDYEKQNNSLINLYSLFIRSIDDMLGHSISPESFVNYEIKEDVAGIIFEDLVRIGLIKKAEVVSNVPNDQMHRIHNDYGISVDQLNKFLDQHKGPIDEIVFLKAIRESFSFPSRIEFWKELINQKVLHSVERYVVVNEERLKIMDPALMNVLKKKIDKGDLSKEVVNVGKCEILLIAEAQSQLYFEKEKFIDMIGRKKYNSLQENGLLSFNERATIEKGRIDGCVFSAFDSITVHDITTKTRITTREAMIIIDELLAQNVLEKRAESFALTVNNDDTQDVLLPSFPVYEDVVRNVLASCFAYRLALRNIARQLEEEESSDIRIELKLDPYRMFFNDLLQQQIIQPPMLSHEEIDGSKLKELYGKSLSKGAWKSVLSKEIGLSVEYTESLFGVLLEKRWIFSLKDDKTSVLFYKPCSKSNRASIADLNSGIGKIQEEHGLDESYDVGFAVEKWFNNQLLLSESTTAEHIENVLRKSKSSILGLNVPQGTLKSIMDFYGKGNFGSIDEMRIIITNGLEHLLELGERKWTIKMILNTSLVLAIGVAQIAIGAIMEVYSVGLMTHAASSLISEGVNDIMYAVDAAVSGNFSWQDYANYKWKSVAFSICTAGVGMYVSKGVKLSRIGLKIVGPSLEYVGKRVAGKQLIKTAYRMVVKATAKSMALKTAKGVSFALSNTTNDMIVADYLQTRLNSVALEILSGIRETVKVHIVAQTLQKAYYQVGQNDAKALVDDLTNVFLVEQTMTDTFELSAKEIANSVIKGIKNGFKKKYTNSSNFISMLALVPDVFDNSLQIVEILSQTNKLLDYINAEMVLKLSKIELKTPAKETQVNLLNGKDFERFQTEVIGQWENILNKHVGKLIAQHVVQPVLKFGVQLALSYVAEGLMHIRDSPNTTLDRHVDKLKNKYEKKITRPDMTDDTKRQLIDQYHGRLLKMLHKTRSPSLLGTIIRENVPMDLKCVGACTNIVHRMLQEQNSNITGLTITVRGKKGIEQSFTSGKNGRKVYLELLENHFTVSQVKGSNIDTTENNSLYGALTIALPTLQSIEPTVFRSKLSKYIENNKSLHHLIQQSLQHAPLKQGVIVSAKIKKVD